MPWLQHIDKVGTADALKTYRVSSGGAVTSLDFWVFLVRVIRATRHTRSQEGWFFEKIGSSQTLRANFQKDRLAHLMLEDYAV